MATALVLWLDWPAFAPIATENAFCNVEPARDPSAITLLWREIVLIVMARAVSVDTDNVEFSVSALAPMEFVTIDDAFTVEQLAVLNVSTLLHVIADPTPDVNT